MPRAQVDALLAEKVEAIAVCLINSFANPAHELMIKDIVRRKAPDLPVCISYEVLPEIKEYERTSTTVINAYVMPIVATYLAGHAPASRRRAHPGAAAARCSRTAGSRPTQAAAERPHEHHQSRARAGGVVGAQALALAAGLDKIITFDMGGTTAKASMVEDGQVMRAHEYAVGAGIMVGSRLLTGAGYTLQGSGHRPGRGRAPAAARTSGSMPAAPCRWDRRVPEPRPGRVLRRRRHGADGDRRQRDPRPT